MNDIYGNVNYDSDLMMVIARGRRNEDASGSWKGLLFTLQGSLMSGLGDDVGPWSADGSFDDARRYSITFLVSHLKNREEYLILIEKFAIEDRENA